ncbi:MAG: magnesium chelatase ATPase subunit D, partial [Pseudomonadota bacterium]
MRDLNDGFAAEDDGAGGPEAGEALWARAGLAATLLAVDPKGLGGAALRARPGHARDAWCAGLRHLLGDDVAWLRLPPACGVAPLMPGLDLAATLAEGRAVRRAGLLSRAAGGVLVVPAAERLERSVVGALAQHLDAEGSAPAVIAFDEGAEPDERSASSLEDRLAFRLLLDALPLAAVSPLPATQSDVLAARALLPEVAVPAPALEALVGMAAGMGIGSARPPAMALAAARAHAALDGRREVDDTDAAIAAELVLLPRALWLPGAEEAEQEPEPEPEPEESPPPESQTPEEDETDAAASEPEAMEDRLLDAVRAALPPALLASLLAGNRQRSGGAAGAAGARMITPGRGRP